MRQDKAAAFDVWAAAHAADLHLFELLGNSIYVTTSALSEAQAMRQCLKTVATTAKRLLSMHISVPRNMDSLLELSALQHLQTCALQGCGKKQSLDASSLSCLQNLDTLILSSATFDNLCPALSLQGLQMH